ncbi:MAG: hypothetical protein ACLQVJ_07980 [Syntrophobacteraceae bacterium]
MGMDLIAMNGERWSLSYGAWAFLLELAEKYGWEPGGTTLPDNPEYADIPWDGGYGSSDFQAISAADVMEIAAALERAITAEPEKNSNTRREFIEFLRQSGGLLLG